MNNECLPHSLHMCVHIVMQLLYVLNTLNGCDRYHTTIQWHVVYYQGNTAKYTYFDNVSMVHDAWARLSQFFFVYIMHTDKASLGYPAAPRILDRKVLVVIGLFHTLFKVRIRAPFKSYSKLHILHYPKIILASLVILGTYQLVHVRALRRVQFSKWNILLSSCQQWKLRNVPPCERQRQEELLNIELSRHA